MSQLMWFLLLAWLWFGAVHAISGAYVTSRYGDYMRGSHLHYALTERWFIRSLKLFAYLALAAFIITYTVFLHGGGSGWTEWFGVVGNLLYVTFIELPGMILKAFFTILSGGKL